MSPDEGETRGGIPEELRRVYEAAWIEVAIGGGRFVFPPVARGAPPLLPSALRAGGFVITACNPRSQPLSGEENHARQEALAAEIDHRGWRRLDAVGHDGAKWREPSFAVIAAPRAEILELARQFSQNAVYEFGDGVWRMLPVSAPDPVADGEIDVGSADAE